MDTPEQLRDRVLARYPGATVRLVPNGSPSAQVSLWIDAGHALEIARMLRDDPELALDQCSNVTGIDWRDREVIDIIKETQPGPPGAPSIPVERKVKRIEPGYLEVVYHLYSVARRQGPVILRLRTGNRSDAVTLPSLTPIWRSCEFQEREVFDLFGVVFSGHPDLRRILMWDEYVDHPMRKDYVEPDDYEWEPTPHGEVLAKAKRHYPAARGGGTPGMTNDE